MALSRERAIELAINTAVIAMALAIPFGIFMALYTNNGWWFWLCALLIIFLS